MKTAMLGLLSLLLTSCAQEKKGNNIDAELQVYVSSFENDAKAMGRDLEIENLTVKFGESSNPNQLGLCSLEKSGPIITVSRTNYDNYVKLKKFSDIELVMYHELGHCILFLRHNDSYSGPNQFPSSIMHSIHFSGLLYKTYKQNYLKELFQNVYNDFNLGVK